MLFPWKLFLLLSGIATLLVSAVAVKKDQVCYGYSYHFFIPWSCSHRLQCQQGSSIFLTQAVRGFKEKSRHCDVQSSSCRNEHWCCRNDTDRDCAEVYTQAAFTALADKCWNKKNCEYSVQAATHVNCGGNYESGSGYSIVKYLCLSASGIHSFTDSTTLRASSLALRYESPDAPGSYVCLVEAADCSSHTANVLLAKSESTSYSGRCSSMSVHTANWLPCSRWYATYTLTTPFGLWLYVDNRDDMNQAWVVIHGIDSSTLQVHCKRETTDVSLSPCSTTGTAMTRETTSAVPTTQTADSTTRPDTSVATAFPSSDGTGASDTSSTSTLASGSSSDVMKGIMPQSAENTGSTAAVVGGVVGVVVLLVVVALVAIVFFLKRRRKPAASPTQEEDSKAYSTLSDLTRSQARAEADYVSLGQSSSVNRGWEMAELGADNSAYSNLSDLTREQPGFRDNCETLNQTAKSEKKTSAPENRTYVNF